MLYYHLATRKYKEGKGSSRSYDIPRGCKSGVPAPKLPLVRGAPEDQHRIALKQDSAFNRGNTEIEVEGKTLQQPQRTLGTTYCYFSCTHSTRSWFPVPPLPHHGILGKHPLLSYSPSLCKQEIGMCLDIMLKRRQKYLLLRRQLSSETQLLKRHCQPRDVNQIIPPAVFFYTKDWSTSLHAPNSIRGAKDCPFHQTWTEPAGLPQHRRISCPFCSHLSHLLLLKRCKNDCQEVPQTSGREELREHNYFHHVWGQLSKDFHRSWMQPTAGSVSNTVLGKGGAKYCPAGPEDHRPIGLVYTEANRGTSANAYL